ncbi:MAG: hypothetical protein M3518_12155, partial [Actinomycetota bacterium]|nr:hypothetical protein [Actinomycetota bacterium]
MPWPRDEVLVDDVEVADVRAPVLVASFGPERHLLFLFGRPSGFLQAVEPAVYGENAPHGAGAEVDADARQRGTHPELAEGGVLLQLPHGGVLLEADLPDSA